MRLVLRLQRAGSGIPISFHGHVDVDPVAEHSPAVPTFYFLLHTTRARPRAGSFEKSNVFTISIVEIAEIVGNGSR